MKRLFAAKIILFSGMMIWQLGHVNAQCHSWNLGPQTLCTNDTAVLLTGATPIGGTYFGPGVVGSGPYYFDPGTAGAATHLVQYTGGGACTDTVGVNFTVNAAPVAGLTGLDTAYCEDHVPQTITPTGSPSGGTLTGPGVSSGVFNIGTAGPGNHVIKYYVSNTNCTDTAYAPVHVRALPNVFLNLTAQRTTCAMYDPFVITGGTPIASPPQGYYTGSGVDSATGSFSPDTTLIGWNAVTYTYSDGFCSDSYTDSILVYDNPDVSIDVLNLPDPCVNDGAFDLGPYGMPGGGSWTSVSGHVQPGGPPYYFDPLISGAGTHDLSYSYTDPSTQCSTDVTQNITVLPKPIAIFNPIPNLCENSDPVYLLDYTDPDTGWFTGTGVGPDSVTLFPLNMGGPGSYPITFHALDTATGCSDSTTTSITLNPKPVVTFTADPLGTLNPDSFNIAVRVCAGDTVTLNYTTIPTAGLTFVPSINMEYFPGYVEIRPPESFTYLVRANGSNGCNDSGSVDITVIQPASAQINGDSVICWGDTTELTAVDLENETGTTFSWVGPSFINPPVTGATILTDPKYDLEYEVVALSATDGNGKQCSSDTTSELVVVRPLPLITTMVDTAIFMGDSAVLKAYGGDTYVWSALDPEELSCPDDSSVCNNPTAIPIYDETRDTRIYTVIGTDSNGCANVDSMTITLNPKVIIFVPTAFSPNGDGINDELMVKTKGIETIDFEIYDRYGRTVYSSQNMEEGWDGTAEGEQLSKDVFFYRLSAKPFKQGLPIDQAGQISLIR